ncbi:MAG: hypothetical protein HOE93_00870 [Nitrosopumilus sp.]|nr:hypothetical protein [Nitrosopumilus sp.]MBT3573772.1 hypothetical protein [Nitrosopumilus sp.]MBT3861625.1 hypothetical protein [Nitrosopumilus sp.]MBT3955856.1 hypothetical protein [Nitrosopumilus sp.]MBT4298567.1 hypothetical protein [Nitrosopumilus sp.]
MISNKVVFFMILIGSTGISGSAYAEPTVTIEMDKTIYTYCERLFYTIEVSEITGDPAIIHIRDETGKGSSAIPIEIKNLINPVPSLMAFEKEVFPLGKYFVDVEYSNSKFTAEFELIDSNNICIPNSISKFLVEWLTGKISDGYLIDAFQKYVDPKLISIPFEINGENIHQIDIPEWTKNITYWWIQGGISDNEFAQIINYLIEENIISPNIKNVSEI